MTLPSYSGWLRADAAGLHSLDYKGSGLFTCNADGGITYKAFACTNVCIEVATRMIFAPIGKGNPLNQNERRRWMILMIRPFRKVSISLSESYNASSGSECQSFYGGP